MAIYPTVNLDGIILNKVTAASGNTLTEPHTTTIPAGGYTEAVGFAGAPINVQIQSLGAAGGGDSVAIEVSPTIDFAVVSTHRDSPISVGGLTNGQFAVWGLEGQGGYWRIKNNATVSIQVSYWRLPNRR